MASDAADLHRTSVVVDTHVHGEGFVPKWAWAPYRTVLRRTIPPDVGLDVLAPAGVDAVVAKAVGDGVVTHLWLRSRWDAVVAQLERVRAQCDEVGGVVALDPETVRAAAQQSRVAVVPGLEGADVIGDEVTGVDRLHDLGVRIVGLVHLVDNAIGTICRPWHQFVHDRLPALRGRRARGLTPFGADVVARMNEMGMVIDVAHADTATLLDVCGRTGRPVVSTHTGARALEDFDRYLTDEEVRAVAGTGGAVGLWPYRHGGHGVADLAQFGEHAAYLVDVAGPQHVCIGTDMNGVPGTMAGYGSERDFPSLTGALVDAGLSDDIVAGILGENFLRVWEAVAA